MTWQSLPVIDECAVYFEGRQVDRYPFRYPSFVFVIHSVLAFHITCTFIFLTCKNITVPVTCTRIHICASYVIYTFMFLQCRTITVLIMCPCIILFKSFLFFLSNTFVFYPTRTAVTQPVRDPYFQCDIVPCHTSW